jgi:hypothetical protein
VSPDAEKAPEPVEARPKRPSRLACEAAKLTPEQKAESALCEGAFMRSIARIGDMRQAAPLSAAR